jgi:hypothetical protein
MTSPAPTVPNRVVFSYGPYQIWVEDDRMPQTGASARVMADAAAERGASCTRCTTACRIRIIRSHEPAAALCESCLNPHLNDALSTTRG